MPIITDQYSVIRALKAKSDCGNIQGETQPTYTASLNTAQNKPLSNR